MFIIDVIAEDLLHFELNSVVMHTNVTFGNNEIHTGTMPSNCILNLQVYAHVSLPKEFYTSYD